MKKLGKNKDDQKRSNWGLILQLIAAGQCSSRIDLARTTGLTKTAISQITGDMISRGYLKEAEKEIRMETGRNPVRLVISDSAPKFIGLLIERTYCAAVLCDMNLRILKQESIIKEWETKEELEDAMLRLVDSMMEEKLPVAAIGAASIGPVNVEEGRILKPYYFHGIHDVHVKELLQQHYHLPVYFDHDNQSAVLAEYLFGNGRGYQDILLIGIGRGIGSGIIVQGHRVRNSYGDAPEFGHISIDYRGRECVCGNRGCLEMYVNSDAMMQKFAYITGKELSFAEYMKYTDDPQIDRLMRECVDILVSGIVNTLNVLNSQIVLLGMTCVSWPDKYISLIEDKLNQMKFGNKDIRTPVRKVYFGEKAQLLGAACNAMNWVFDGEALSLDRE